MTRLHAYLSRKIEATKNPSLPFEPDPVAEEGLVLLQILSQKNEEVRNLEQQKQMLTFDVEAEKRNVEFLKKQRRQELIEALT
jgi:hypothetical protein